MTEEEVWLRFACAAIAGHEVPDDFDGGLEELVEDISEVAEAVADDMMEAFRDRFSEKPGARRPRRGGGRGRGGRRERGSGDLPPSEQD